MATMFYQQLINRKTVSPHDGPFQIPLLPSGGENMTISAVQMQPGKKEREREREERGYYVAHFSRGVSLTEPSNPERRNIRARFVYELSVQRYKRFLRERVLTSAYLHTSGPRKHLLKPVGFHESIRSLGSRFTRFVG